MKKQIDSEIAIRELVRSNIKTFAQTFSERHISEIDNPNGTLNMKIHNVFISALGEEIQYFSALVRSFDSSLGNMLESLAGSIARFSYIVTDEVVGPLYPKQTTQIADLLEAYKNNANPKKVAVEDYKLIREITTTPTEKVTIGKRNTPLGFMNTNRLVRRGVWDIGLSKTGFIREAGRCLVMQTTINNKPIIMVFLKSHGKYTRLGDANRVKKWIEKNNYKKNQITRSDFKLGSPS